MDFHVKIDWSHLTIITSSLLKICYFPLDLFQTFSQYNFEHRSVHLVHICSSEIYRRNPAHRAEMAHPGDVDYRRPNLPNAPTGTPPCPWGAACYRRNPQHFIQLSHPPASKSRMRFNLMSMEYYGSNKVYIILQRIQHR